MDESGECLYKNETGLYRWDSSRRSVAEIELHQFAIPSWNGNAAQSRILYRGGEVRTVRAEIILASRIGTGAHETRAPRLLALARELHMSEGVWAMLCILESVHGLAYAERAAREWPAWALRGGKP